MNQPTKTIRPTLTLTDLELILSHIPATNPLHTKLSLLLIKHKAVLDAGYGYTSSGKLVDTTALLDSPLQLLIRKANTLPEADLATSMNAEWTITHKLTPTQQWIITQLKADKDIDLLTQYLKSLGWPEDKIASFTHSLTSGTY